MDAVKEQKTLNEIASNNSIHPNQVSTWKKKLLVEGLTVFGQQTAKKLQEKTARAFTSILTEAGIRISMDGRGRAFDNIFVERLWRTVKYENIYIKEYSTVPALFNGLENYFQLYNYCSVKGKVADNDHNYFL